MYLDYDHKPETIANIGGKLVKYDVCSSIRKANYSPAIFRYIGKGFIWSVGGVKQGYTEKDKMYFWVYRSD